MAKKIKQYRYWGKGKENNYPNQENYFESLLDGRLFEERITQLSMQGPAGVSFWLNANTDPIMIGFNGFFNLEVDGYGYINSLKFKASYDEDNNADELLGFEDNNAACLIIDIVYEEDDV